MLFVQCPDVSSICAACRSLCCKVLHCRPGCVQHDFPVYNLPVLSQHPCEASVHFNQLVKDKASCPVNQRDLRVPEKGSANTMSACCTINNNNASEHLAAAAHCLTKAAMLHRHCMQPLLSILTSSCSAS